MSMRKSKSVYNPKESIMEEIKKRWIILESLSKADTLARSYFQAIGILAISSELLLRSNT